MTIRALGILGLLAVAVPAPAQTYYYRKHAVTLGMGAALPRADLNDAFSDAFTLNVAYGYRFHPWFQADIGFDTAFGSADVYAFIDTPYGPLKIRDYQHFLPMGGRVVVPLAQEKVLLSAGGGGVYMRYSERVRQPYADWGYQFDCWACNTRDGWGYYALVGGSVALDQARMFRIGATGKVYRGETEGPSFGNVPFGRTRDHWIVISGDFSVNF
jgi:hypothetical protein